MNGFYSVIYDPPFKDIQVWTISPNHLIFLKNCVFKKDYDNTYSPITLQILEKENLDLINLLKRTNQTSAEFLNSVYVSFQFILLSYQSFRFEEIKLYQNILLRKLYLYNGPERHFIESNNPDSWMITTADKRPFGDSYIEGSLGEVLGLNSDEFQYINLLKEFEDLFDKIIEMCQTLNVKKTYQFKKIEKKESNFLALGGNLYKQIK